MPYRESLEWNEELQKCELLKFDPGAGFRTTAAMITFVTLPMLTLIAPERFVAARLRGAIIAVLLLLSLNYAARVYDEHWPAPSGVEGNREVWEGDDGEPGLCDDFGSGK